MVPAWAPGVTGLRAHRLGALIDHLAADPLASDAALQSVTAAAQVHAAHLADEPRLPLTEIAGLYDIAGLIDLDWEDRIDRKVRRFMGAGAGYNFVAMEEAIADAGLPAADGGGVFTAEVEVPDDDVTPGLPVYLTSDIDVEAEVMHIGEYKTAFEDLARDASGIAPPPELIVHVGDYNYRGTPGHVDHGGEKPSITEVAIPPQALRDRVGPPPPPLRANWAY